MLFTTLSTLIRQSFEDEFGGCADLPGRAEEPLLASLDPHAIVRAMRDPDRSLGEQGAILAAVIRCYRRETTPRWSALLLEMLSPTLVASSVRFPYLPLGVSEEDVQQQVIAEALHAARVMRLPEAPGFTRRRLGELVVSRTARALLRAAAAETESLEQLDAQPSRRFDLDPDQAFLLELARGDTPGADLAFLYVSKVLGMTARELAIAMGASMSSVLNRRRRALRRLRTLAPETQRARIGKAAAA